MCLANGLTDAFALEARPTSATYNPVTAAAWNAAARADKAAKKRDKDASSSSDEENAMMSDAARSDAEAKLLGASCKTVTPGEFVCVFPGVGIFCHGFCSLCAAFALSKRAGMFLVLCCIVATKPLIRLRVVVNFACFLPFFGCVIVFLF